MSITKADLIAAFKSFIFGSQGAQLQQKAGTRELLTEDTGIHITEGIRKALREELRALELADQLFFTKVRLDNYKWYANPVFDRAVGPAWDDNGIRDPMVIVATGGASANRFRMYYAGNEAATGLNRLGCAHSPDGVTWARYAGNPILGFTNYPWEMGNEPSIDPYMIRVVSIWYLYYEAKDTAGVYSIGVATSSDGLNWTKQGRALAPTPYIYGEDAGVASPIVYYNPYDSVFYMFFEGLRIAGAQRIFFTGLATSTDGITFTKVKVIDRERQTYGKQWHVGGGGHDFFKLGDLYLLVVGYPKDSPTTGTSELSYIVSLDLENWYSLDRTLMRQTRGETLVYEGSGLDLGDWIYWWYSFNDATHSGRIGLCRWPRLGRFQPIMLWRSQVVVIAGGTTVYVEPDASNKTFHLMSNMSGTLYIQTYNEVTVSFDNYDTMPVSANVLASFIMTGGAGCVRLSFVPSAQATVSAWVVIE